MPRGCYYNQKPQRPCLPTRLGNSGKMHQFMRVTYIYIYIYTREKIARYSFSAILSNSFVSSFFLHDSVSRSFPLPFSVRPLRRRKEGSELPLGPLPFERESGLVGVHEEVETIATRFPPIKFPATNFSSAKSPRARERELGRNGDRSF